MDPSRAINDGCDLDVALVRVGELAANPPSDWSRNEWLGIVVAANARAISDPLWFKVTALAYETGASGTDATSALWAWAHILISLDVDETNSFRTRLSDRDGVAFVTVADGTRSKTYVRPRARSP